MRKTELYCTIAPKTGSIEIIKNMIKFGMDYVRLNLSHGTYDIHKQLISNIKEARKIENKYIPIIMDTKGPEYRIGDFANGTIELVPNSLFTFTSNDVNGDKNMVSLNYKNLYLDLSIGDIICVDNGLFKFEVIDIEKGKIITKVLNGGVLGSRKSMSFPGKILYHDIYLSEQDKKDILFCIQEKVDYLLCSFVSRKEDIIQIKKFLHENGGDNISVIAKIESQNGVNNILDIISECDYIVLGRGDLGNEIPYSQIPIIQKELTNICKKYGKKLVLATEIYQSMQKNIRPTRAEVSDVANAIIDGVSGLMLTGETAEGDYPIESIKSIIEVINVVEEYNN